MRAQYITQQTGGRWFGSYGLTYCPAHPNTRTPALSLGDGDNGRLLAHCHAGCEFRDVIRTLDELGLLGTTGLSQKGDCHSDRRSEDRRGEERRRGTLRARSVWHETAPIDGTLAERYLRRRSISMPLPNCLRFHSACWHPTAQRLPALVARISKIGSDDVTAVHRTFLRQPGNKAMVSPVKAMLGPATGCGVTVTKGSGPLIVAEGIETALSLADGLVDHAPHTVAALSTSGVSGLLLPAFPHELIVAPDGDAAGEKAAQTLAKRAAKLGWRVRILPAPGQGLDWNDVAERSTA